MDGFVIAHALGWLCKTLMIRDFWMTNLLSVTFEFLEYSLEHQLPNFSECWWDHWIMDVLGLKGVEVFFRQITLFREVSNFSRRVSYPKVLYHHC